MQCVRGRDKLVHAYYAKLEAWIDENLFMPCSGCSSKSKCAVNKPQAVRRLPLFRLEDGFHSILSPWDAEEFYDFDYPLCTSCLAIIRCEYECACEDLWSDLP